jgi:hypothetical protein
MEIKTFENRPKIIARPEIIVKRITRKDVRVSNFMENSVFVDIIDEAGQDVFDYLGKFKITEEEHILFLSYTRHYYYDSEELKKVGTILNFRLINRTPHLWYYLRTMNRILSMNGYFAGCFLDYRNQRQTMLNGNHSLLGHLFLYLYRFANRVIPRIPFLNKLQLLVNQGKIKCVTRDEVTQILKNNGFQVVDMTEFDRLTYFIARKTDQNHKKASSMLNLINQFKTKSSVINI